MVCIYLALSCQERMLSKLWCQDQMHPCKAWNIITISLRIWCIWLGNVKNNIFSLWRSLSSSCSTTFAATDEEAEDEFEAKVSQHYVIFASTSEIWSVNNFPQTCGGHKVRSQICCLGHTVSFQTFRNTDYPMSTYGYSGKLCHMPSVILTIQQPYMVI